MNVYKSKVDTWLVGVVVVVSIGPIVPFLLKDFSLIALFIVATILVFVISLLFTIVYVVVNNKLIIKYGYLFSLEYNIKDIKSITPTHTFMSAPAASLDRLKIDFGSEVVVVSPKEKDKFIKNLKQIANI